MLLESVTFFLYFQVSRGSVLYVSIMGTCAVSLEIIGENMFKIY